MEPLVEVDVDLELRRQTIADWIQGSLKPAKRLIEEHDLPTQDEEIIEEAMAFEARDYQLDAWGAVWDARQAGAKSGLIHLATGLGKTSVGVFDVIKFREEFREANGRDPKVLFACHKNEILEQAAERFKAFIPDASQGFYNGDDKDRGGDITFATMQSLHSDLRTFKQKDLDYIIYDEAHHAQADTFAKVVKKFKPAFQLALTATPDRMDEQDIRELFGEELFSKGLTEALADGWLATPDYHIVFDDAVKEAMESGFEATSLRALAELFDVEPRNEVIAEDIKKEMERIGLEFGGVKTIVFCQNIEHAEEMADLLGGKAYHSEASAKDRKAIFDNFKDGDLQVITTRDMFNEGVDVPDARLIVFLRSTSSKTVFEQQLGRGLRKHAGKDRVSVLDFVANVERIAMIQKLAETVKSHRNMSDGGGLEGDKETQDQKDGGLNIHTVNGDFDFDKLAVNLLEKYRTLKEQAEHLTPEKLIEMADMLFPGTYATSAIILAAQQEGKFVTPGAVNYHFGTLKEFNAARGLSQPDITDPEYILEQADALYPGVYISASMIEDASSEQLLPSVKTIARAFNGSLTEFNAARGFTQEERTDFSTFTNDELVELANELAPNRPMALREIKQLSKDGKFMGATSIVKRFESLNRFNAARGLDVKTEQYTKESILAVVIKTYPGQRVTTNMIKEASKQDKKFPGLSSIAKVFGSIPALNDAIEAQGQD